MDDFNDDVQAKVEIEIWQLLEEEYVGRYTLFTDEASIQRVTGLKIILESPQRDILPQAVSCEFDATNKEVEYEALLWDCN